MQDWTSPHYEINVLPGSKFSMTHTDFPGSSKTQFKDSEKDDFSKIFVSSETCDGLEGHETFVHVAQSGGSGLDAVLATNGSRYFVHVFSENPEALSVCAEQSDGICDSEAPCVDYPAKDVLHIAGNSPFVKRTDPWVLGIYMVRNMLGRPV